MKKNAMLKIAAILLVAVLLTTCAISATFAKYVTTKSLDANQNARVAKWGVTVDFTGNGADDAVEMFKTQYTKDSAIVVLSDNRVVAPGTANDNALTVTIKGTPEVAVAVTSTLKVELANWTVDLDGDGNRETDYMPVKFYIAHGSDPRQEITVSDLNNYLSTDLAAEIMGGAAFIAPAEGAPITLNKTFTISWEWDYEASAENIVDDEKDTLLGNTYDSTIAFTGAVTVSQYGSNWAK